MKARVGSIEVEGTPEEIAALIRSVDPFRGGGIIAPAQPTSGGKKYVSEDVAFRTIRRRPLTGEQTRLLSLLRQNHPRWTSAAELQKALKYTPSQLAGSFGAFGKRVGSTEGYEPGSWFFEQEYDYDEECYNYRLPDDTLQAVKRAGL